MLMRAQYRCWSFVRPIVQVTSHHWLLFSRESMDCWHQLSQVTNTSGLTRPENEAGNSVTSSWCSCACTQVRGVRLSSSVTALCVATACGLETWCLHKRSTKTKRLAPLMAHADVPTRVALTKRHQVAQITSGEFENALNASCGRRPRMQRTRCVE